MWGFGVVEVYSFGIRGIIPVMPQNIGGNNLILTT